MPRLPTQQLSCLGALLLSPTPLTEAELRSKVKVSVPTLQKLIKTEKIMIIADGCSLATTDKGKRQIAEAGKTLAVLLDYDNLQMQARDNGFDLDSRSLTDFLEWQALKRGLTTANAKKFLFITSRSGGTIPATIALAETFDRLGYGVVITRPLKDAADRKMIEIAEIVADDPRIKTVFWGTQDSGKDLLAAMAFLKKKKKAVISITVEKTLPSAAIHASELVQIQSKDDGIELFRETVRNILNGNTNDVATCELIRTASEILRSIAGPDTTLSFHDILDYLNFSFAKLLKQRAYGKQHYHVILEKLIAKKVLKTERIVTEEWRGGRKCYRFDANHPVAKQLLQPLSASTKVEGQRQERKEEVMEEIKHICICVDGSGGRCRDLEENEFFCVEHADKSQELAPQPNDFLLRYMGGPEFRKTLEVSGIRKTVRVEGKLAEERSNEAQSVGRNPYIYDRTQGDSGAEVFDGKGLHDLTPVAELINELEQNGFGLADVHWYERPLKNKSVYTVGAALVCAFSTDPKDWLPQDALAEGDLQLLASLACERWGHGYVYCNIPKTEEGTVIIRHTLNLVMRGVGTAKHKLLFLGGLWRGVPAYLPQEEIEQISVLLKR